MTADPTPGTPRPGTPTGDDLADRLRRLLAAPPVAEVELVDPPPDLWDQIAAAVDREPAARAGGARPTVVEYVIDARDVVVGVGGHWDDFAVANGAPALAGPPPDRVLWDAMSEGPVRDLWRALVGAVRGRGRPVTVSYRCDGPDVRRWFDMELRPGPDGAVRFSSRLTAALPRPEVALLRADAERDPGLAPVEVCCWCAEAHDGAAWRPVEEVLAAARLLERTPPPPVSYGLCPSCAVRMSAVAAGT